jgi:hypothetical protein
MNEIKWREVAKAEYETILMMLRERYELKGHIDDRWDIQAIYENTGQEFISTGRWFAYRTYAWQNESDRFFINSAIVKVA